MQVADVETFDAFESTLAREHAGQGLETLELPGRGGEPLFEREPGVVARHAQPFRAFAAHRIAQAHPTTMVRAERGAEPGRIRDRLGDDDVARNVAIAVIGQVELWQEGREQFGRGAVTRVRGKEGLVAEHPAMAHEEHLDAGDAAFHRRRDDIEIAFRPVTFVRTGRA